jgi:hypothetical protein
MYVIKDRKLYLRNIVFNFNNNFMVGIDKMKSTGEFIEGFKNNFK